jgi:heterodisulfide reductase subunit C
MEASTEVVKPIRFDASFKHEIMSETGGETLKVCFQCGTCTSGCPIARFSRSYRPRQIIQMIQLGMRSRVLSSDTLWLCAACFTCTDRCPQDVEVASVLRVLRNLAVKEGFMPGIYKEMAKNVLGTGYAYKITDMRLRKRGEFKLPPLPRANLEDLAKLAKITKFTRTVETREGC